MIEPSSYPPPGGLRILAQNLRHKAELHRIIKRLNEQRIDHIVLKGVPLTLELFGSLEGRSMVDVDVVVRKRNVREAYSSLRSLGFRDLPGYDFERSLAYNYQHPLVRTSVDSARSLVELHWNAFDPNMFTVPEELLFAESGLRQISGQNYPVMSRELTLCHLAAHALQHELSKPTTLVDLGRAWEVYEDRLDLGRLLELAAASGTFHALAFLLDACHSAGLCTRPPPAALASSRATLAKHLLPADAAIRQPTSSTPRAILTLGLLKLSCALDLVGSELVPHPKKLEQVHGKLSPTQMGSIYLTRPLGIVSRTGRPQEEGRRDVPSRTPPST